MEEQFEKLNAILQARVRYVRKWNAVDILRPKKTSFIIKWYGYMGDPDNSAYFESKEYPIKFIEEQIKEHARKLKKDIPSNEYKILKKLICG